MRLLRWLVQDFKLSVLDNQVGALTYQTSYHMVGPREGLTDVVADLFADDTPLFSMSRKVDAISTKHEWQSDNLESASRTGLREGADIAYTKPTVRVRVYNYTQIRLRNWDVSFTAMKLRVAGIKNLVAREVMKALKEIAVDYEKALLSTGDRTVGTTKTAATAGREMRGLLKAIVSNTGHQSGGASQLSPGYPALLSENMVNSRLQEIWTAGGDPRALFCGGHVKRTISQLFSAKTGFTFNINASTRTAIANINKYEGSFGTLDVIPDRQIEDRHIAITTPEQIRVAVLRDIRQYKGARTASSIKGWVEAEMTLEYGNEKAHAEHDNLKNSGTIS